LKLGSVFLKCPECGFRFNIEDGFYTHHECPKCTKYVSRLDINNCLDDKISKDEKRELIMQKHARDFFAELIR